MTDTPQEEPYFDVPGQDMPPDHRSGYVALVGKPNVGKSTLLNTWLGQRLAAVSAKPQTTRNRLLGILTRPDAQVIFVDTPGIHRPRTRLAEAMVTAAKRAIPDADVVLFVAQLTQPPGRADREIAALVDRLTDETPVMLVLNMLDAVEPAVAQGRSSEYGALGRFRDTLAISALNGAGCDELLERVIALLPQGPRYYAEDQLSDVQERFVAAELVREQVLEHLQHEVPHATAVVVTEFKERENGVVYIEATIYAERDSQKGIIIGRRGEMLKRIGAAARRSIEAFLGQKVYLELWVKVLKNWRQRESDLKRLGYAPPETD